jgi:hypothetical protein
MPTASKRTCQKLRKGSHSNSPNWVRKSIEYSAQITA